MTNRPLLLTLPYLALWLWLLIPFSVHVALPMIDFSGRYVAIHVGQWAHEIDRADNVIEAYQILRQKRVYRECEYLRLGTETASLLFFPAEDGRCKSTRLTRDGQGHVYASIAYGDVIDEILVEFR